MCTFLAMSCAPGPLICRYTPALVLFWNVLWSTSASSAATLSTLPDLLPNVLRVIRVAAADGGTLMPASPVNTNPSTTTWAELVRSMVVEPPSSVAPTPVAVIRIGAAAVPLPLTLMVPPVYRPAATVMVSPATAAAAALDNCWSEATARACGARVCAARLGQENDRGTAIATAPAAASVTFRKGIGTPRFTGRVNA